MSTIFRFISISFHFHYSVYMLSIPFMKLHSILFAVSLFAISPLAHAEAIAPIPLWPEGVPGEASLDLPAESVVKKGPYQIDILSNVSTPTLTIYPAEKPNGVAVLVCPGGAYNILAMSHEGTEVCEWLNSIGITAGLLKYRVPRREGQPKHAPALQDAQRAIGLMRSRAEEWKIDPHRLGVLGFSAGGHLAAVTVAGDGARSYKPDPKLDAASPVPDFGILLYPAYLLDETNPDFLSAELDITPQTAPLFLAVANDDKQFAEGSARIYIEMRRNDRPCELHIFAKGGHGFGLRNTNEEIAQWPRLAEKWMKSEGILGGEEK